MLCIHKGCGRRFVAGLITLATVAACSSAESRESSDDGASIESLGASLAPDAQDDYSLLAMAPAGTTMTFRLGSSLSTESSAAGDRFEATLAHDVRAPTDDVMIPAGTRAGGVVTVSEESQSAEEVAVLELVLEALEIDGQMRPIRATTVDARARSEARDSGGESAAKVAVGTAAGALVGRIIGGDRQGALIGAGAGAVAGTAVAVTTDEGHARIEEGSTITIVLDEALRWR